MKPKPFCELKNLTVPVAISASSKRTSASVAPHSHLCRPPSGFSVFSRKALKRAGRQAGKIANSLKYRGSLHFAISSRSTLVREQLCFADQNDWQRALREIGKTKHQEYCHEQDCTSNDRSACVQAFIGGMPKSSRRFRRARSRRRRQPLASLTPQSELAPVPYRDCCRITTNFWHESSRRCRRRPGYVATIAGGLGPGGRKWHRS